MLGRYVEFTSRGVVGIKSYEVPRLQRDEILVRVRYSAISPGTERANLLGDFNTETSSKGFPYKPGYSSVGEVIEVGSGVKSLTAGAIVGTMASHRSHVICKAPFEDPTDQCFNSTSTLEAKAQWSWRLPDGVDQDTLRRCAAFIILTVGLYGAAQANISIGDTAIVIGLGPIGLSAGQFARIAGAMPVIGVAPSVERRQAALLAGFDTALPNIEQLPELLPRSSGQTVVIEASGVASGVISALKACPKGARLVLLGSTRSLIEEIDFYSEIHRKAITIVGAHQPTRAIIDQGHSLWKQYWDAAMTLRMILSKRLVADSYVTHVEPVHRIQRAYELICGANKPLGVILDWCQYDLPQNS